MEARKYYLLKGVGEIEVRERIERQAGFGGLGFWQSRRQIFEGEKEKNRQQKKREGGVFEIEKKNLKEGRKKKRASGRRRYEKKSGEV